MKPLYSVFTVVLALLGASCGWTNQEEKEPGFQEQKPKVDTIYYVDTVYIDSLIYPEAYYPEKCPEDIGCTPSAITLPKDFNGHFFYFKKWDTLRIEDGTVINYLGGWQDTTYIPPDYIIESERGDTNDSTVYICTDTIFIKKTMSINYAIFQTYIGNETIIDTVKFPTVFWISRMHNCTRWHGYLEDCSINVEKYIKHWETQYYTIRDGNFLTIIDNLIPLRVPLSNQQIYMFDIYAYRDTEHGGNDIIFYLK
ncbi:hypothetical protein INQ51_03500 [Maribellus sp. CM-23]|uniref:hypothetical protein n=1 Tax=Maribellus sp. CM-23 TaxID=2781026 RepID=UPI001F31CAA1|nr:hypothetical protein [Maribellus sp. CM-23]MCE4563367.1 hypothetical protein [Maribellus sp. CM-23]